MSPKPVRVCMRIYGETASAAMQSTIRALCPTGCLAGWNELDRVEAVTTGDAATRQFVGGKLQQVRRFQLCRTKQEERNRRISSLPAVFHEPIRAIDTTILNLSVSELVSQVHAGILTPQTILVAYSKAALKAHQELNCLTEIMIATAETWAQTCDRNGPLAGVPVSLKDTTGVQGWDSCLGYSERVNSPMAEHSALVKILLDAGAVPFVKTNIPTTLLAFESNNDVFGRCLNPHNKNHSPGGSTGGEAALLAFGGSRIGIGTDVGGSVRIPSHYSGVYSIKASAGRFPRTGSATSIPGQEGVPPVYSPMARTLPDLETFWRAIVQQEPWKYDHSCLVMPWKEIDGSNSQMKWGVLWDDGVIAPSPACKRALNTVVDLLQKRGHLVKAINPPSPYEGLKLIFELLFAGGARTVSDPLHFFESNDPGVSKFRFIFALPRWIKRIYAWYLRYIRREPILAGLIEVWHECRGMTEYLPLVAKREAYRKRWFDMWQEEDLDFILTVPNALPAIPQGGLKDGLNAYGYTSIFNLLDYTAGVLPVTKVDRTLDQLPSSFQARNGIEADTYRVYDAKPMDGLPIGVQVVGKRLEEEKVLEGMKIIHKLLEKDGKSYPLLNGFVTV